MAKRRVKAGVMILNPFGVLVGQGDGTNPLADKFLAENRENESIKSTMQRATQWLAPAGSKAVRVVIAPLSEEARKRSLIVIDPKGEVAAVTRDKRKKAR